MRKPRRNNAESAREAGLHYVSDSRPGIERKRRGKSFTYIGPDGKAIRGRSALERIRSLVIPPAWSSVWICPLENGHLQELFPGVAVLANGGVVDGEEAERLQVVHPLR